MSLSYNSPSQSNLIQPDIEPDLEAARGTAPASTRSNINGTAGNASSALGQQGQMATVQREQSIWEQSACVCQQKAVYREVKKLN